MKTFDRRYRITRGPLGRIKHFLWRTTEGFVVIIILITSVITFGGMKFDSLKVKLALADTLQAKVETLKVEKQSIAEEREILKQKLAASSQVKIDDKTRQIVLYYIKKYFGDDYDRAVKVFTCESGLSPQTSHTNTSGQWKGTIDRGIAQINDHFHAQRFEQMNPGISFEVGAHDTEMNLKYARYLYDNSKGWGPWACRFVLE